ncbi:Protein kinase domain [Arabidopsis thaliana x Arabidopsis arenosa]|uniref:non-specific serine/threonine protein kinase n=1 Tax=Arabidopsis thaliana x Arabidopsis arenosa TaxID=1240361 RepID=A0A8T1Z0H9_9BRAS|nr:Protein kinase domain [Arabidopsis thaliana x Arabidopsis arenosa]
MKRFFCCLKGGSSRNAGQCNDENDEINLDRPFGNNERLNHLWRNHLALPDDREVADPTARFFPISPPIPDNCGASFLWRELVDGTINFRDEYFLGKGNFGDFYRCRFSRLNEDGAVKIQKPDNPTGHVEFLAEVTTLHAANHPNVIGLLGNCYGQRNRAIVYEFMHNSSLERHIFAHATRVQGQLPKGLHLPIRVLDWDTRMRIALGVAKGLVYLHQELKVINRDVKAGNILLDANFVPKLTDFGLATKIDVDENGEGIFGIHCTGRRDFPFIRVWPRLEDAPVQVDVALGYRYSVEGLKKIFDTARMCIKAEPLERPTMSDVEAMVLKAASFPVQVPPPQVKRRHSASTYEVFSGGF